MPSTSKLHRQHYNRVAKWYAATKVNSFFHEKPFRRFVELTKPGATILDIGCAHGIHVPLF